MYLHEFQAKNIFKENGILVPKSFLLKDVKDIASVLKFFSGTDLVLKAQIHSGSKYKYGGVIFVNKNYDELHSAVNKLLGKVLVTDQTGLEGKVVNEILIEERLDIKIEYYVSLFFDRNSEQLKFLISFSGGSGIEELGCTQFLDVNVNLLIGICDYQIREIIFFLKLDVKYFSDIKNLFVGFLSIFLKYDLLLLEVNPLIICNDKFFCLDAKVEVDDNSFYRNNTMKELFDFRQENVIENEAKKYNLSYISLDGNIGCLVNGAGLAMATMDLIKLNDGSPANFLDIGGDATEERVFQAIRIILLNKSVKCILINIFGGIVRCDLIANSLVKSFSRLNVSVPIVVRLSGNMSSEALIIINKSGLNIKTESDFLVATKKVIDLSKGNI